MGLEGAVEGLEGFGGGEPVEGLEEGGGVSGWLWLIIIIAWMYQILWRGCKLIETADSTVQCGQLPLCEVRFTPEGLHTCVFASLFLDQCHQV